MYLLLISLGVAVGFTLVLYLTAKAWGNVAAFSVSMLAAIASCLLTPVLAFHFFTTTLLMLGAVRMNAKPRVSVFCSMAGAVVSYSLVLIFSFSIYRNWIEMEKEFPIVSLKNRLAYESSHPEFKATPVHLSGEVEANLTSLEVDREESGWGGIRVETLERLHNKNELDFALQRGFGVGRMIGMNRQWVELPEYAPVRQPGNVKAHVPEQGTNNETEYAPAPSVDDMEYMHRESNYQFLDQERFGYIAERGRVAGFEPHHIGQVPELFDDNQNWQVTRLELISLLRHKEPVAYVSDYLPDMEELQGVPTRKLTAFESSAIEKLRTEEDVVIDEGANQIRMVGSLRAAKDCMSCHSVSRGVLLGAFSYDISRVKPIPTPALEDVQ